MPRAQWAMLGALLLLLAAAQIDQSFPEISPLHHVPTLAMILAAPLLLRRRPLSTASVACVIAFLALHTIGGRYTYSNVPYDAWFELLSGHPRNMYDRFVHFAYGLLAVRPAWEALRKYGHVGPRLALWLAVAGITALSGLYEIFEWLLTLVLAGPLADDYNGQQGDMWDAQKDMALALGGALISAAVLRITACRSTPAAGSTGPPAGG